MNSAGAEAAAEIPAAPRVAYILLARCLLVLGKSEVDAAVAGV